MRQPNQYDINSYNNEEMINILGLINPSDRELEAKLIELIRKYSFIRTPAGKQLYKFFTDMYDHFFEPPDEDNDEEAFEGFTTMQNNPPAPNPPAPNPPASNPPASNNQTDDQVALIQQLDYTAGKLNPILKETYKRTISIDSQYRDSEYAMTTDFALNFTETLKDVVSIKLYAIQLPVTWYTINENYGSNFFYLKSSTPGIDNENHEYRIEVSAGNYSPSTLQTAISESFTGLRTTYPDVNFGSTQIAYNTTDCKSTITMDIQKVYNEHNYELHFEKDANATGSLAQMLGFQQTNYTNLYSVFSGNRDQNAFDTSNQNQSPSPNAQTYNITTSNRTFKIIQYNSELYTNSNLTNRNYDNINLNYSDFNSTTESTQEILLDVSYSQIETINFTLSTNPDISLNGLLSVVNNKLIANEKLDSTSGVTYDHTNNRFVWKIKLNRDKTQNIPNAKTVLVFPYDVSWSETTPSQQLWVDYPSDAYPSAVSAFGFERTENMGTNESFIELSELQSENTKTTKFNIAENTHKIRLVCENPSINPQIGDYDTSYNSYDASDPTQFPSINPEFDFEFVIEPSTNYVQTSLTTEIQDQITTHTDYSNHLLNTGVRLENNQFFFNTVVNKSFDASKFATTFSTIDSNVSGPINSFGPDIGSGGFNMEVGKFTVSNEYIYTYTTPDDDADKPASKERYTISGEIFTINSGPGTIFNDVSFVVSTAEETFTHYRETDQFGNERIETLSFLRMQKYIQDLLNDYQYDTATDNYPLRGSTITISQSETNVNKLDIELKIKINFAINSSDYRLEFIDLSYNIYNGTWETTKWYNSFNIQPQYSLSSEPVTTIISTDYAIEISGGVVELDQQTIDETITLKPMYDTKGGVYVNSDANDIVIPVNTGSNVTRDQLADIINEQLSINEYTRGSYIELIKDELTSTSFTKFRWNINKVFTSKDYRIVFYDIYSFVKCNESTRSYRNATIDNTLGWILGFRTLSEYALLQENIYTNVTPNTFKNPDTLLSTGSLYTYSESYINDMTENPSNVITTLKGDTTVSVNLYNYFMIILDDFNQNHLNDGLVTVTKRDNSVTLPSYANRKKYTCDPITGEVVNTGIRNGQNNLTQNQLYSLNQIINTQNQNRGETNSGPFIRDMFALIPVKTSGMTPGSIFVEFGGTLQNQERMYFGPVNINRMHIKLINDRGDVVDLNGANWSIQLVCEQLYQKQKGG